MKTARERAKGYLSDHFDGRWDITDLDMLEIAFKEQDKITRHACAEAVLNTPLRGPYYDDGHISKKETHHRVINVKAV